MTTTLLHDIFGQIDLVSLVFVVLLIFPYKETKINEYKETITLSKLVTTHTINYVY